VIDVATIPPLRAAKAAALRSGWRFCRRQGAWAGLVSGRGKI